MSGTDFQKLNIILAARDAQFAKQMERNQRRIEQFARKGQKDLSQTSRGFDVMGGAIKKLGPIMAGLSVAAVISNVRGAVAQLDEIGKTADRLGLTTDALQELRAAAESAGVAQNTLDMAMQRFGRRVAEARQGTGEAEKALIEMGISLEDAQGNFLSTEAVLDQVADRMQSMASQTDKNRLAMKLFDSEGVALVNLLREGSAGMAQMREDARSLGIVIDESLIRNAEGAQTQLDLMGRVVSAQLNGALVEMAPLIVGSATAFADLVRMIASAVGVVADFLDPQTELQLITENLVLAMGDEITQSQLLETALRQGINVSVGAATAKLDEAMARHENVKAIIAEYRAQAMGSDAVGEATSRIKDNLNTIRTYRERVQQYGQEADKQALRIAEGALSGNLRQRQSMLEVPKEIAEQYERTLQNIAQLQDGIAGARGGVVDIAGDYVAPIDNSEKKDTKGSGGTPGDKAERDIPKLTDYAAVLKEVNKVFGENTVTGRKYGEAIAAVNAMHSQGKLSAEEHKDAIAAIEEEFEKTAEAAKNLEQMAEQTMVSIVSGSESAADAVANLLDQLASLALNAAFSGMFSGMFDSVAPIFDGALSFDGGGHTGGGKRSGGLDGKGGFMAMLHPQESVIDHTKGQRAPGGGGGSRVEISVVVSGARGNQEVTEMVENGVRRGLGEYDRNVLPRRVGQIKNDPRRVG